MYPTTGLNFVLDPYTWNYLVNSAFRDSVAHVFTLVVAVNTKGASVNFASNVHDVYRNVMLNSLPIACNCERLLTAQTNTIIIFLHLILYTYI